MGRKIGTQAFNIEIWNKKLWCIEHKGSHGGKKIDLISIWVMLQDKEVQQEKVWYSFKMKNEQQTCLAYKLLQ